MREGWRYVRSQPLLRTILVMMAVIGTLQYNFQVILPLLARETFNQRAVDGLRNWRHTSTPRGGTSEGTRFRASYFEILRPQHHHPVWTDLACGLGRE